MRVLAVSVPIVERLMLSQDQLVGKGREGLGEAERPAQAKVPWAGEQPLTAH